MLKGKKQYKKYSPEFKLSVIIDMREHGLSYHEVMRKYFPQFPANNYKFIKRWERIYLEEGAVGFMVERRGRSCKGGRPRKEPLDKEIENDLIAENQRLKERLQYVEAENEYLKKLDALVRAEEERNGRKPK